MPGDTVSVFKSYRLYETSDGIEADVDVEVTSVSHDATVSVGPGRDLTSVGVPDERHLRQSDLALLGDLKTHDPESQWALTLTDDTPGQTVSPGNHYSGYVHRRREVDEEDSVALPLGGLSYTLKERNTLGTIPVTLLTEQFNQAFLKTVDDVLVLHELVFGHYTQ